MKLFRELYKTLREVRRNLRAARKLMIETWHLVRPKPDPSDSPVAKSGGGGGGGGADQLDRSLTEIEQTTKLYEAMAAEFPPPLQIRKSVIIKGAAPKAKWPIDGCESPPVGEKGELLLINGQPYQIELPNLPPLPASAFAWEEQ